MQFKNSWLSRYPRPNRCIHDQGNEFVGFEFQEMLRLSGIQDVPITVRNPQANAICERMHQTITKSLRILIHEHPPNNIANIAELVDSALATSLHAIRSTVHSTLGVSPSALVFHRDMLHDIPIQPNFERIQVKRQALIDSNLR
jgi:transposase InsO family protein